jgi:RNA polymerase sigma-70 factor (ECF subfamily)
MLRKSSTKDGEPTPSPDGRETVSFPKSEVISEEELAAIVGEYSEPLKSLAIRKFRIPDYDAEGLVHDVFLSYVRRHREVKDLHHWLIGAICNASRYYWRKHGRNIEQLDDEIAAEAKSAAMSPESFPARTSLNEVLAGLPSRYQDVLRLRYVEGCSIKEIAEQFGVTQQYTYKLVAKSLEMAMERYRALESADTPEQHREDNRALREVVAGFVEAYQDVG